MVVGKAREYVNAWRRILVLSRRPDQEEFMLLARLNALGFTLIGGIGYIIHLLYILFTS